MAYRNDALEQAAITQIFVIVAKITGNVSHIIFHNHKFLGLCGFIIGYGASAPSSTVSLAVYSTVILGFVGH